MENMPIWIIVFLFYYKMFLSKIAGLNSASFWFRVSLNSSHSLNNFFRPTETETLYCEWVLQGQFIDTTMMISKTCVCCQKRQLNRQLNIVFDFNSRLCKEINKNIWPKKVMFSFCHYEWLYDSYFLFKNWKSSAQGRPFLIIYFILFIEHILSLVGNLPWGLAFLTSATQAVPGIRFSSKFYF